LAWRWRLRDGIPVLGVVFAYGAPDNRGDLFAWAEGCGPLRRNGVEVVHQPWALELTAGSAVVVSQAADHAPVENLTCAAPARIRAEASVAYRMALVAAGEGEAGSSLAAPGGWDLAGGHALLRANGGIVVDEGRAPVTYTRDGHAATSICIFGAPAIVPALARRPWESIRGRRASSTAATRYDRCWPVPGRTIADAALLERAQGCLLGQLTGDALGSMVEFMPAQDIARAYPHGLRAIGPSDQWQTMAGQPTDDSQLALLLARTLLEHSFDEDEIAAAYSYWLTTPPFDIGNATQQALGGIASALKRNAPPAAGGRSAANKSTKANGALMRQSPLAIWGHALEPAVLDAFVRAETMLTHPSQVCQDASAAFIVALAAVIREEITPEDAYRRACAWDAEHGRSPVVARATPRRSPSLPTCRARWPRAVSCGPSSPARPTPPPTCCWATWPRCRSCCDAGAASALPSSPPPSTRGWPTCRSTALRRGRTRCPRVSRRSSGRALDPRVRCRPM
jgi:hypothetical protein